MMLLMVFTILAQAQGWLEQYSALILAIIAVLSSALTGYFGLRQKKTPTGEAQLDDERAYRIELRNENKDLRAEKAKLEDDNDALRIKVRELDNQVGLLRDEQERNKTLIATLTGQIQERDAEIRRKDANIQWLNSQITDGLHRPNGKGDVRNNEHN